MLTFFRRSLFGLMCLLLVAGFTWLSALPTASASLSALPTRARATLTPSRTPTSTPTSTQAVVMTPSVIEPTVGYIALQVNQAPASALALVQWQDGLGGWNTVEGWQTDLPTGQHTWAVLPQHFGQGPFRWVVYDRPGGRVVATSTGFTLPAYTGDIVYTVLTAR